MDYPNPHGLGCFWHEYAESQGAPNIKWCEETLCQVVSEPANTWSNIGYLIAAFVIIGIANHRKDPFALKHFGLIVFFMGAMSLFYHQSNYYTSQILDFVGMFFFVGWILGINFIRLGWIKKKLLIPFNLTLGLMLTGLMHWMYLTGIKFQGIILFTAFAILATEFLARKNDKIHYKNLFIAMGFLIVAFGFSIADGKRIWCDPTAHGWFSQGHAVWHWVASIAMPFIYLHYSQPALKEAHFPKKS